jgi:hypothetical protein
MKFAHNCQVLSKNFFSSEKAKTMSKLWVQLKPYSPTRVSTQDCQDIDDFKAAIKKGLLFLYGTFPDGDISLSLPVGSTLAPDLLLKDLLNQPGFNNTAQSPIYIGIDSSSLLPTSTLWLF